MPLATAPNIIEQSSFAGGWQPDIEPAAVPDDGLLNAVNLIPDVGSAQPQVRPGYAGLPGLSLPGFAVRSIHPYPRQNGDLFLIVVATSDAANTANAVQVWQYDVLNETSERISPTGLVFQSGGGRHYGMVIDDVYYGGSELDPMYSWDGMTFTQNAGTPDAANEFVEQKAYRRGDRVRYTHDSVEKTYAAVVDWAAPEKWSNDSGNGVHYVRGEKVTNTVGGFKRTYKAIRKHNNRTNLAGGSQNPARAAVSEPGTGSDWREYWKPHLIPAPLDTDGNPHEKYWREVPEAPVTNVATFHGNRVFARDDAVRSDRILFSRMADVKEAAIGAQLNLKDWRVTGSEGAGWLDFKTPDGTNITALHSFGYYLLVFKPQSTHVVAGVNPESWTVRKLDDVGAINRRAVTTHDGIVYFVGDRGFYMTDGSVVEPVPGSEKIEDWLRRAMDRPGAKDISVFSFRGFVYISTTTEASSVPDRTVVYDPTTQAFWPTTLPIQEAAVVRVNGVDQLFFVKPTDTGSLKNTTYSWASPGVAPLSTSSRSDGKVNRFLDPSFEYKQSTTHSTWGDFDSWLHPNTWISWSKTHDKVVRNRMPEAGRRGALGGEISNTRVQDSYEGIRQLVTLPSGTHVLAFYVRRPHWKVNPAKPNVRLLDGATVVDDPNFEEIGRGWWRVWTTVAGGGGAKNYGVLVKNGLTVQVDQAMLYAGSTLIPYFDGDGGDATSGNVNGGGTGKLYQFARISPETGTPVWTDDGIPITWSARTAWFAFGVMREERQVRKVWALVRGSVPIVLRTYRSYLDVESSSLETVPNADEPVTHFEGLTIPDATAVSFQVEGTASSPDAPALLGVAALTKPRRIGRYHT